MGKKGGDKKKPKAKAKAAAKSTKKAVKKEKKDTEKKSTKKLTKLERLEEARKAFKWWEAEELPDGIHWRKLEHSGIVFAPAYKQHNVPLIYNGKKIEMNSEQEEIASFYAAMPDDGPQLGNPKTRKVFQDNFFKDFKETFPSGHVVKKFSECEFHLIKEHLDMEKSLKKAATDAEMKQLPFTNS